MASSSTSASLRTAEKFTAETDVIPGFQTDSHGKPIIPNDAASLYAYGHLIRSTEQLILSLFGKGLLSGTTHTCLGQELCQMSVVRALQHPDDIVLSNHRNHGHFLTYSGQFLGLVAEVMGREDGVCAGYGGSQHLAYRGFHSNGVQGGMTAIAVGLALSAKLSGDTESVVAAIIGDGTLGQGLLYESLNLASIWNLPILYIVENNRIAQTTPSDWTVAGTIEGRAAAFGLNARRVSDDDPALFLEAEQAVAHVRQRRRPELLIIDTCRLGPHSKGDDLRDAEEVEAIRARDPLARLGDQLEKATRDAVESRNRAFIEEVERRAMVSAEARFSELPTSIFKDVGPPAPDIEHVGADDGQSTVRASLNRALRHLLQVHEDTILLGEDLHDPYGGAFKISMGLSSEFPSRVISTPISEAGIMGTSIGLAMRGYSPILEVMFADFLTLCMDQIYNHAVKFPGMFPDVEVSLVVRAPSGGRRGYGPTHSQSPENVFTSVPGLTVVYGSHRHDVGQLLIDASRAWRFPVLFLEHKLLYSETQAPGEFEALPADVADLGSDHFPTMVRKRPDADVTVLSYGGNLPFVERAVQYLEEEEELVVEIVVPALLAPLPKQTLIGQLKDAQRLVIVEESHHEFGVGAEILAILLESGFQGRAVRVGTPPVPIPSARSLEEQILPDERRLAESILELF